MHPVQLGEVGDASLRLVKESVLLVGEGVELALDAAHLGNHGVEVLQDLVRGCAAVNRGSCRFLQEGLDGGAVLLDGEVGGAEVVSQDFVWQSKKGLVLLRRGISMVASGDQVMGRYRGFVPGGHGPDA